ncbi:hypothetical protein HNV12_28100 [Methanococcoides sp. SA1]|nr:hypothetical protein [Methanococcoides sp. SA1]
MSKYKIETLNKSVESKAPPEIARTMFAWEDERNQLVNYYLEFTRRRFNFVPLRDISR